MSWDPALLPSQAGRTAVVTGGNAGIGFHVSRQLAGAGARVVLASRSPEKARAAIERIRTERPGASLAFVRLDLASLASVRTAAAELRALGPIDVLVNNAGRTDTIKERQETEDGLELIVGTNALGPFALTGLMLPALAPEGRVVGLGSFATRLVTLDIDDLQSERGAWPVVRAAVDPDAANGTFWGPRFGLTGEPAQSDPVATSRATDAGAEIWRQAEVATGVAYELGHRADEELA